MQSRPKYRRMRGMLRLRWSASPRRLAIALVIGAVATAATTRLPLHLVDRGHGGQIRTVHRGVHAWWHARDHAWGLRWSNLQLIDPPLSTPVWEGELHGWEEPPAPPYPAAQIYRVGTLASGPGVVTSEPPSRGLGGVVGSGEQAPTVTTRQTPARARSMVVMMQ